MPDGRKITATEVSQVCLQFTTRPEVEYFGSGVM